MFCSGNPHLLGQEYSNLPKILSVFGDILETELVDESLTLRIVAIIKQFQTKLPEVMQKIWSMLSPTQQQKLKKFITH